ncbi:MAG: hypothetical protein KC464_13450 [Myxococcales bacterium]|nr:hypothetical protein [Myxococcales bacterium]
MKRSPRIKLLIWMASLVGLFACSAPPVPSAPTTSVAARPVPVSAPAPVSAPVPVSPPVPVEPVDAAPVVELDPALAPLPSPEDLDGAAADPPPSADGSVSGTAFWVGPSPGYLEDRPLRFGSAHPRDWQGAKDAEYWGLEGVVVSATPLDENVRGGRVPRSQDWPDDDNLTCYKHKDCVPHVTVSHKDVLLVSNLRSRNLSLQVVDGGRVLVSADVAAKRQDAAIDLSGLGHGTFEIKDGRDQTRIGWLVHATDDDHIAGATSGNCRYNLDLAPGRYKIIAWHPYLTPFEAEVTVRAGIITRVNPVFTADNLRE